MEKIPTYEEIKEYRVKLKNREIKFEGGTAARPRPTLVL